MFSNNFHLEFIVWTTLNALNDQLILFWFLFLLNCFIFRYIWISSNSSFQSIKNFFKMAFLLLLLLLTSIGKQNFQIFVKIPKKNCIPKVMADWWLGFAKVYFELAWNYRNLCFSFEIVLLFISTNVGTKKYSKNRKSIEIWIEMF